MHRRGFRTGGWAATIAPGGHERGPRVEPGEDHRPDDRDRRLERARGDAMRRRDLNDHGPSLGIGQHQVKSESPVSNLELDECGNAIRNMDPDRRSCSAHGAARCGNEGVWMLQGKGVTYPACQRFLDEHPDTRIHE